MKRSMKFSTISILTLAGSMLAFGNAQPRVRPVTSEAQDVKGAAPAVQQGKGSGLTRNQSVSVNNQQTEQNAQADAAEVRDSAFRK